MDYYNSNCQTCNASLERGYCATHSSDGTVKKVVCIDCRNKSDYDDYRQTKELNSNLVLISQLAAYDIKQNKRTYMRPYEEEYKDSILEIDDAYQFLRKKGKQFESQVWFAGLQAIVRAATKKGVSAKLGDLSVLTYCMAGRCMFTFERPKGGSVTYLTDETSLESCLGFQGISGTLPQAIQLVDDVIMAWKAGKLDFQEDTEVHIAGF